MARKREGFISEDKQTGKLTARIQFNDETGKRREITKRVMTRTDGYEWITQELQTLREGGQKAIDGERMTFAELCDYYKEHYLQEPTYAGARKVSGLRSKRVVEGYVEVLREHFGKMKLKAITYGNLKSFKAKRLGTKTHQSEQRSLSTVHRELAYARRLLNIAEREGWIQKNPFKRGEPLICSSDEEKRARVLSRDEETRLLAACLTPAKNGRLSRKHLRPLIIAAIDTGCRLGELLKLRWSDVDMQESLFVVRAMNTKTMRERTVSMTIRLKLELEKLRAHPVEDGELVFGVSRDVRQSFGTACELAQITGLRFHDLRHTAATRMVAQHIPLAEVGKVLGHATPMTTYRYYVNETVETTRRAAAALDEFNIAKSAESAREEQVSEMVN